MRVLSRQSQRYAHATMAIAALSISTLALPTIDVHANSKANAEQKTSGPALAYVYPVMGPRMSSDYGSRKHPVRKVRQHHDGIDLAAPIGAPIRAIADGQVVYADPHGGYGRYIVVRHTDGYTSHYGHCDKVNVAPGQTVSAGQVIGTVGSSGISTGPHLHFEIRRNGVAQNPEAHLPGLDDKAAG